MKGEKIRIRMMNKRGLSLAINTLVVLVLAMVVLAFMVLFFTDAAGDFGGVVKSYFSYSNIDRVVDNCNVLVDLGSSYTYCCEINKIKFYTDREKDEGEFSCFEMVERFGVEQLSCSEVSC